MSIKSILITGARSLVALDLARIFSDAGIRVICTDSIEASICKFSRKVEKFYTTASPAFAFEKFVSDLEEIIEREKIDYIIPTCEEIFYLAKAKDRLSVPVFCEAFKRLDMLHNKWKFYQLLLELGLNTPETTLWNGNSLGSDKWIVKPVYSRFGARIQVVQGDWSTLKSDPENPLIAQRYIDGEKFCSYSVCHKGKVTAHSTYKVLHSMGIGSAICIESVKATDIENFVKDLVLAMEFTGQIAFDFIRSDALYCIECNPRGTSGVHLFNREKELAKSFFDETAFLSPEKTMIMHEHLFMLWFGFKQKEIFSKGFWRNFFLGKSLLFSKDDKAVLLGLPSLLLSIAKQTLFKKQGFHQAMSFDMEYNGETT